MMVVVVVVVVVGAGGRGGMVVAGGGCREKKGTVAYTGRWHSLCIARGYLIDYFREVSVDW
jgi:hypothetical protein